MSKQRKKPSRNPAKKPGGRREHQHDHDNFTWIRTEPTLDGKGFMVTLEIDADHAITLTKEQVLESAYAVYSAVAYAEYDAAVLKQMGERVDLESAGHLIVDLRKDRPPLDFSAMAPMALDPGVSHRTREGFLNVLVEGKPVAQMDLPDARQFVSHMLDAIIVADLDAAYLRCLKGVVGIEDEKARFVVDDLQDYR